MVDYIKLQEIAELRNTLKIKELNEELLEHLQLSIMYILKYCDEQKVPLPDMDRIESILDRADDLIYQLRKEGRIPPNTVNTTHFSTPKRDTPEDDRTIGVIILSEILL
jgi:hypothetical protein